MEVCNWENCNKEAEKECVAKDGKVFSKLCKLHYHALYNGSNTPRQTMRFYIKSLGGHKSFAKYFADAISEDPVFKKLIEFLKHT